jgi:hypothetical protein
MAPTVTLRTRKPISSLTPGDIKAFPVWEFATDEEAAEGRDETWIRPVKCKSIPSDAYSLSVGARFETPSGQVLHGIVTVTTAGEFETVHAAILASGDYIFIPWPGYHAAEQSAAAAARQLSLSPSELFPLRFTLGLPLEGESAPRSGTYAYEDAV